MELFKKSQKTGVNQNHFYIIYAHLYGLSFQSLKGKIHLIHLQKANV